MSTIKRPEGLNKRKCHDCGKLTTNYRCSKCLEKWRKDNGVMNGATSLTPAGGPKRHTGIGAE